jgi:hypothetical protein
MRNWLTQQQEEDAELKQYLLLMSGKPFYDFINMTGHHVPWHKS